MSVCLCVRQILNNALTLARNMIDISTAQRAKQIFSYVFFINLGIWECLSYACAMTMLGYTAYEMWVGVRLIRQVNGCCWQGVTWWQWFVRDEDVGDSDLLAGFFSQSRWIWAQSLANQKLGSHPNPAHILKTFSVASLGVWEHWKKKLFVKVQKKRKWKDSFYMLSFLLWWKQCKSSKSWFHI